MRRVLVTGTGITAATTASLLRQELGSQVQIELWDKARGTGGRMSTTRSINDSSCTLDLGAQYISITPEYKEKYSRIHNELIKAGVLTPLKETIEGGYAGPNGKPHHPEGTEHYVTPSGVSSLVKHFLKQADASVKFQHHIENVSVSTEGRPCLSVTTASGDSDKFDCVILTMPVPQILQLKGTVQQALANYPEKKSLLEGVQYSSRYALGLFYQPGTVIDFSWAAKYFYDGPCIRFVSIDTKKRGLDGPNVAPSVVVHTSVPFGLKYIGDDREKVQGIIMEHLTELLPSLPKPSSIKCQKWRFSQVYKGVLNSPGCLVLQEKPLIICGGDAFTHSGFDGCLDSAMTITETVAAKL